MAWILNGITEVLISLFSKIMQFFFGAFSNLSLDIGYNKSTFTFGQLFDPGYYNNATGLLDKIFPAAGNFLPLFEFLGFGIVFAIMIFKILQSIFDTTGKNSEHPVRVIGMSIVAALGVAYSYSIFIMIEIIANELYQPFRTIVETDIMNGYNPAGIFDYLANPSTLFNPTIGNIIGAPALNLIALVLLIALLVQFVRLILEAFERYVVLGLMFYTSPLAFSCLSSQGSKKIFSNWAQMLLSQYLLMIINLFFLGVFYAGFAIVFSPGSISFEMIAGEAVIVSSKTYIFENATDFVVKMFILIGWLTVGQKVDQHLRALGLSVSQTGAGLGAAILAGAAGAVRAIQMGTRLVKSTANTVSNIKENVAGGRQTAAANDLLAGETRLPEGVSNGAVENQLYANAGGEGHLNADAAGAALDLQKHANGDAVQLSDKASMDVLDAANDATGNHINPVEGPDGTFSASAEVASAEMGYHKVSGMDSEGNLITEIGNADDYHAVSVTGEDAACIRGQVGETNVVQGATQGHIDQGVSEMGRQLPAIGDSSNITTGVSSWTPEYATNSLGNSVPTGVQIGKDAGGKEVARWMPVTEVDSGGRSRNVGAYVCMASNGQVLGQASLDGVVDMDRSKGSIVNAHNDTVREKTGFNFSVQNLSDKSNLHTNVKFDMSSGRSAVYNRNEEKAFNSITKIKPAAQVKLAEYSRAEKEGIYSMRGHAEAKEVQAKQMARQSENVYTEIGRSHNRNEGKSFGEKFNDIISDD